MKGGFLAMRLSSRKDRLRMGIITTVAAFCWAVILCGQPLAAPVTDIEIQDAIEDELLFDQVTPVHALTVESNGGVITLTGNVNTILAKERAEKISETVKGVNSVINRIEVNPLMIKSDKELKSSIKNALLLDPAAESYEIDVAVADKEATLTGTVDSWQERRLAEKTAKGVEGLKKVINNIDVDYKKERSDQEILNDVEQALRWDILVDHKLIDVEVDEGEVTLSGTVGSVAEKTEAESDAYVAGVKSVDTSKLDIKFWARDERLRQDKYVVKSDENIKNAVEKALLYDPRVNSFNVFTDVSNGVATLRGEVDNLKAKRSAGRDARNTVGVWKVENRLKVKPSTLLSDNKVARNVREALSRDPSVDRYEITVNVNNGVANLYGEVDTSFEKAAADDVASKVEGVLAVDNNLVVSTDADIYSYDPYLDDWYVYDYDWYAYQEPGKTMKSDAEIREDLKGELFWSPFVDSDQVNFEVNAGVVELTGSVDSWMEYHAAAENALQAGAVWVDNDLVVK